MYRGFLAICQPDEQRLNLIENIVDMASSQAIKVILVKKFFCLYSTTFSSELKRYFTMIIIKWLRGQT